MHEDVPALVNSWKEESFERILSAVFVFLLHQFINQLAALVHFLLFRGEFVVRSAVVATFCQFWRFFSQIWPIWLGTSNAKLPVKVPNHLIDGPMSCLHHDGDIWCAFPHQMKSKNNSSRDWRELSLTSRP